MIEEGKRGVVLREKFCGFLLFLGLVMEEEERE